MDYRVNDYIHEVMAHVSADTRTRERLAEDLRLHIEEALEREDVDAVLRRMGDPRELAVELMDTLYDDKAEVVRELIDTRAELRRHQGYVYRSRARLFGVPLVHINVSGGNGGRAAVAKGIIAIGDISIGVVAIGGVALGGICFGGVALGLLCFAGLSLGLLLAIGGAAVGYMALGGLAVGVYAMGGAAFAQCVAVGGHAQGHVAIGDTVRGANALIWVRDGAQAEGFAAQARAVIQAAYPNIAPWLLRVLTLFMG